MYNNNINILMILNDNDNDIEMITKRNEEIFVSIISINDVINIKLVIMKMK